MDNRMQDLNNYIYMQNGKLVYQSIYEKQFTPDEFSRLLAICEDYSNDERINYNAVIKKWEKERNAEFKCERCDKITPPNEQCYDESADIIVCSACSQKLTRLDDGPGRYVAHTEEEEPNA